MADAHDELHAAVDKYLHEEAGLPNDAHLEGFVLVYVADDLTKPGSHTYGTVTSPDMPFHAVCGLAAMGWENYRTRAPLDDKDD